MIFNDNRKENWYKIGTKVTKFLIRENLEDKL